MLLLLLLLLCFGLIWSEPKGDTKGKKWHEIVEQKAENFSLARWLARSSKGDDDCLCFVPQTRPRKSNGVAPVAREKKQQGEICAPLGRAPAGALPFHFFPFFLGGLCAFFCLLYIPPPPLSFFPLGAKFASPFSACREKFLEYFVLISLRKSCFFLVENFGFFPYRNTLFLSLSLSVMK